MYIYTKIMRMKHLVIVLFFVLSITSCKQSKNNVVFDENANQMILYGYVTPEAFQAEPFARWYLAEYSNYTPQEDVVSAIANLKEGVSVLVVLGTWCGDSKREVPRFMKIIDGAGFADEHITIIGVNRFKVCPEANIHKGDIQLVPTFIISKNGKELGRIEEAPLVSLEEDFLGIIDDE